MVKIKRRFSVSYSKVFEIFSCLSVEIISKEIFFFYVDFLIGAAEKLEAHFLRRAVFE